MRTQRFSWLKALYAHKVATMINYANNLYGAEHDLTESQAVTLYERRVEKNLEYAKNLCGGWRKI